MKPDRSIRRNARLISTPMPREVSPNVAIATPSCATSPVYGSISMNVGVPCASSATDVVN